MSRAAIDDRQGDMFALLERPASPPAAAPQRQHGEGCHYAAGFAACEAGKPRELPSYFTTSAGKNPANWMRGWDAAAREQEQAVAEAEAAAERGFAGYAADDENEAGEVVDRAAARREAWERERATIAAAEAAAPPELLRWGKRAASGYGGKYFEIALLRDGARWRTRSDISMPNMGGGGPFSPATFESRDAALVHVLRKQLASIARHLATRHGSVSYGSEADWRDMAAWCIAQAPSALFGGPDLQAEFDQLRATYAEREKLRCAAIREGKPSYIGEDGAERSIYSL